MTEPKKRIRQTFFAFQNFVIHQDNCGMKVCTDSVLFGAFVNTHLKTSQHVLDVGAGTGLLSIMMQQHGLEHIIEAVECDENAYAQCNKNIDENKIKNVTCHSSKIQDFSSDKKFEVIVSNPPFFTGGFLEEPTELTGKIKAIHTLTLSHDDLIRSIERLIDTNGRVFILLPEYEMSKFEFEISLIGYFPYSRLIMRNKKSDKVLRVATAFCSKMVEKVDNVELIIRDENNKYTEEYMNLTKFYYKPSNFTK